MALTWLRVPNTATHPLADAGNVANGLFEFVRVYVAPGADDHVLHASGDVQLAAGEVGEVARIEPAVVKQPARGLGIMKVAARGRRPAELEPPFLALADLVPGGIDNAELMTRQRLAAVGELECGSVLGRGPGRRGQRASVPRAARGL